MAESVEQFFSQLAGNIDASKAAGMNATFQFVITGDNGGSWHVKLTQGDVQVMRGNANAPDITITVSDSDWLDIVSGRMNGQMAFMTGRLKIEGDVTLALKLQSLFQLKT